MTYTRTTLYNVLDLGDTLQRGGNSRKLFHSWRIRTYKCQQDTSWIAIVTYTFINATATTIVGTSEEEVTLKAHDFCEKIHDNAIIEKQNLNARASPQIRTREPDETPGAAEHVARKWMGNKETKIRKRVNADEIDGYLAKGWIIIGPRTIL